MTFDLLMNDLQFPKYIHIYNVSALTSSSEDNVFLSELMVSL